MTSLDDYAFTFGLAYAEACGKEDDFALLGYADKAGLKAAINEAIEHAATVAASVICETETHYQCPVMENLPDRIRAIKIA